MQQFTPIQYIKIAIANAYGLDNLTWDERLVEADRLLSNNASEASDMFTKAKEPILLKKALDAYQDALDGIPTGFIMGLDATASNLQIIACLMGCHKTAERVNLINTGNREDVYTYIPSKLTSNLERDAIKKSIMTTFFGSKAQPKELFGEDTPELDEFYKVMIRELPGGMEFLDDAQSCWRGDVLKNEWTLPDLHTASIKNMVPVKKRIEVDEIDHATFTYLTYENECLEFGLSLQANIVHSVDGYIVREMYRMAEKQGFELLTIHDSFWASPNYMQNVRENYLAILIELTKGDLLENIYKQIMDDTDLVLEKRSTDLVDKMTDAEYALS